MKITEVRQLFDYNYWATRRILAAAQKLSPEQYVAPYPLSHGSLRGTLVHALFAETIWRQRCQDRLSPASLPTEENLPDLPGLCTRWQAEETAMRSYLQTLTSTDLLKTLHFKSTKGIEHHNTLWRLLAHVVNHGTQTRSEAAIALTAFGCSPGDLDMLLYWREIGLL